MAGSDLPDVVERFIADVSGYVRDLERAAREADHFGEQNRSARESAQRMGHAAQEAAERAARSQREAAHEAERLARGQGSVERAAQAAARAQRDLERAQMAQSRAARAVGRAVDEEAEQYRELAREAARAAGAQRLAQMRAAGQIRQHNQLLRRLREEYQGFGDDGDDAFREMEGAGRRAFSAIKSSAVKGLGGIPPMLALLPAAATLAGGGMVLAIGGALAGIGIMAAAQAEKVKTAYSGLKKHVVSELREWAEPFEETLVDLADVGRKTFDGFGPTLRDAFRDGAPAVEQFVKQCAAALSEFKPMINQFSNAFVQVLAHLGPELDTILGNLADGLTEVADAVAQNPEELANLLSDLSSLAGLAGTLTAVLIKLYPAINWASGAFGGLGDESSKLTGILTEVGRFFAAFAAGPVGWVVYGVDKVKDAFRNASGDAGKSSSAFVGAGKAMETAYKNAAAAAGASNNAHSKSAQIMALASKSAKDLKTALDALTGKHLSAREAAGQYGQAVLAMSAALKENGQRHGFATAKGIANEEALTSLARAAHANAVAMRDDGKSAQQVGQFMNQAHGKIVKAAQGMGYSRKQAIALADKLFGVKNAANSIPSRKNVKVSAETAAARQAVANMIAWINQQTARIALSVVGGRAEGGMVGAYAAGGPVQGFPTGGHVRGPGTSTSDSIPAMLSNGEFVVNAAATRAFAPLLQMINSSRGRGAPASTPLPRAAGGGGTGTVHVENHFHIAGTVVAERQLLDLVQRQATKRNVRNPGQAQFGGR